MPRINNRQEIGGSFDIWFHILNLVIVHYFIFTFCSNLTIDVFIHFVDIFVLDVDATGAGTSADPFQTYAQREYEAVLQCIYERSRLKWYTKENSIIASESAVIDRTKYNTSVTSTGLYYRLHVLNAQPADEGIYICRGGLNETYYIHLFVYGKQLFTFTNSL